MLIEQKKIALFDGIFEMADKGGILDLADYGKIISSAYGEPSQQIKQKMLEKYNFNSDA